MEKIQRDKRSYCIASIVGILGLFLLIGVWPNYFEDEIKKDKVYTALSTNTEMSQHPSVKSRAHNVSQPKQCRIDVNAISSLFLLGVGWWLKRDRYTQFANKQNKDPYSSISFRKVRNYLNCRDAHYILAKVVLVVMFVYISYFLYQNYSFGWTFVKDMCILFLVIPLFYLVIMSAVMEIGVVDMDAVDIGVVESILKLKYPVVTCLAISMMCYYFGRRWFLEGFLYNNKLAFLAQGWSCDMQWFFSSYVCVCLWVWATAYITNNVYVLLLWSILVGCLYIQAHWSPQLSSSSYKIIDAPIAFASDTKTLWAALLLMTLYDVIVSNSLDS